MMDPFLLLVATVLFASLLHYLLAGGGSGGGRRRRPLPPGPWGWPVLGNLPQLGPNPHHTLHALSKTYGPLFRLRLGSVQVVVASSAAMAAEFLRTHDANFSNRPPNSGAKYFTYNYQDLVFAPYGPRWQALRKLCALHLFSHKALEDLRPVREQEIARLARGLSHRARRAVNLGEEVHMCVTNALARATVGQRVFVAGGEEEVGAEEFKEMVMNVMQIAGVFNIGDFIPWLGWLDLQGVMGKVKQLHRRFDEFLDKIIEEHRRAAATGGEGARRDLLSVLIGLKEAEADGEDGNAKLTDTKIKALLLNLFIAGTDTTTSTVEWALSELILHPDSLHKARQELDSVVGKARLVSESDLPNLPFLQAVIKETLRLHPSNPLNLPRIAAEACEVAGHHIPKHATLLVNVWAISRDPAIWPNPLEFSPARFLPGSPHEGIDIRGNDFEAIPFGAGRRICAGISLGLRMVQFMTATLLHAFDWALPDGLVAEKLDMEEKYGIALRRAVPLIVKPIPRLAQQAYETGC